MEALGLMDPSTSEPKAKSTRPRKAKSTERNSDKRRLALSLPREDVERLSTHALKADCDLSTLVSKLIRENLREFHIARTPTRSE